MTNKTIKIFNDISTTIQMLKIDIMIAQKEDINLINILVTDEEHEKLEETIKLLKEIDKRIKFK